jgi:hypothetical protein
LSISSRNTILLIPNVKGAAMELNISLPYLISSEGITLTLSQLMLHVCGVSKTFGKWYHKTNKTEDTNKLTLLVFKIIAIIHNTRLATFIKLIKRPLLRVSRSFMNVANLCCEGWRLF